MNDLGRKAALLQGEPIDVRSKENLLQTKYSKADAKTSGQNGKVTTRGLMIVLNNYLSYKMETQNHSIIDLSGLCPYAAGRKLFQETQGSMEQWERIDVSLKAVGYTMDKTKLLLLIEEVMKQTVRIDRGCQPALNPEKTSKEQER